MATHKNLTKFEEDPRSTAILIERTEESTDNYVENLDNIITEDQADEGEETGARAICNCKFNKGKPCHTAFPAEELQNVRHQFRKMSRKEQDIAVLSKLSCGMHLSVMTRKSKKKQTERLQQRTDFYYHGHRICRDVFKFINALGKDKLTSLIKHYKEFGVIPRVHKANKIIVYENSIKSCKRKKTK